MIKQNISMLWESHDKAEWEKAEEQYWTLILPKNLAIEREIENIDIDSIRNMSTDNFYDWLYNTYFVWKYTSPNRLATTRAHLIKYKNNNELDLLKSIHNKLFSFDVADIEKGLSIVSGIRGLGTAGASGLLSILYPKHFGTVDQFVVKSLLQTSEFKSSKVIAQMKPESLAIKDGVFLINIMQEKANELNHLFKTDYWTPRKIDKILWCVGR